MPPLRLNDLPSDVLARVFCILDALSMVRVFATCTDIRYRTSGDVTLLEETIRHRAADRGRVCPAQMPPDFTSREAHLAWLDACDVAWAPVAGGPTCAYFVAGGRLMSCGVETDLRRGALGHAHTVSDGKFAVSTPTQPLTTAHIRICGVSAGLGFGTAVSATGALYTWGIGHNGRLGHGDQEHSLVPRQVLALAGHRVVSVSTGAEHSLAVTDAGEVFSWGFDSHGQCGLGCYNVDHPKPRRIAALTGVQVCSTSAGHYHSVALAREGTVYSFGYNGIGQLGIGPSLSVLEPQAVEALRGVKIASVAAGSFHTLARNKDGTVWAWGDNSYGALGRSGDGTPLPQIVAALHGIAICRVAAGIMSSGAVTDTGKLYTWGAGRLGQFQHTPRTVQTMDGEYAYVEALQREFAWAPRRISALRGEWVVAVSMNHMQVIAVTRTGTVFGWGLTCDGGAKLHNRGLGWSQLVITSSPIWAQSAS